MCTVRRLHFCKYLPKKQIAGYAVDILLAVCYDKSGDFSAAIDMNGGIMMKKRITALLCVAAEPCGLSPAQ